MNRFYAGQACEEIDASIFSGDLLFDDKDRKELSDYIARWTRAISEHERNADDESQADDEQVSGDKEQRPRDGDSDPGAERPVADPPGGPTTKGE